MPNAAGIDGLFAGKDAGRIQECRFGFDSRRAGPIGQVNADGFLMRAPCKEIVGRSGRLSSHQVLGSADVFQPGLAERGGFSINERVVPIARKQRVSVPVIC